MEPDQMSTQTVTFVADDTTVDFELSDGGSEETVLPVVYVNGGPGERRDDGGYSIRLELDDEGRAVDLFTLGQAVTFSGEDGGGLPGLPTLP